MTVGGYEIIKVKLNTSYNVVHLLNLSKKLNSMKNYYLLGLVIVLFATSCKKEEEPEIIICDIQESDALVGTGLIGSWEIQSRSIDNLSDASVHCCEFYEFNFDQNTADFEGLFKKTSSGVDLVGIYVVDQSNGTIDLSFMGNTQLIQYSISSGSLIMEYTYNGQDYYEIWKQL